MPDDESVPDSLVCVYDIEGSTKGKLMRNNVVIDYPMVSIMVRATSYADGFRKASGIKDAMDAYRNEYLELDGGSAYSIADAKRNGNVNAIGQATGTRRRYLFSINYALTLASADDLSSVVEGVDALHVLVHTDIADAF